LRQFGKDWISGSKKPDQFVEQNLIKSLFFQSNSFLPRNICLISFAAK